MTVTTALVEEVVVPLFQAGAVTLAFGFGGAVVGAVTGNDPMVTGVLAALVGGPYLLYALASRRPKQYRAVEFGKRPARAYASNVGALAIDTTPKVKVWVEHGNGADMFPSTIELPALYRVAWHVVYLDGRISNPYLDKQWGILSRPQVKSLQESLVGRGWAHYAGQNNRGGLRLDAEAMNLMRGLCKGYTQIKSAERDAFARKWGAIPSPEARAELRRRIINVDVGNKASTYKG
jgi:hypothetical protein